MSRRLKRPTDLEDEEITRAAHSDPDCPPLTEEELAQFRHRRPGQRGPQKEPVKVPVSLRLDAAVVAWFRETGAGWQTR
jgi:uncharacterized protein (DUF4415 family)